MMLSNSPEVSGDELGFGKAYSKPLIKLAANRSETNKTKAVVIVTEQTIPTADHNSFLCGHLTLLDSTATPLKYLLILCIYYLLNESLCVTYERCTSDRI